MESTFFSLTGHLLVIGEGVYSLYTVLVTGNIIISVADPHHFDPDPDPASYSDADPKPACHFDTDPDPACHFDADRVRDPDPIFTMMRIRIRILESK